MLRRKPTGAEYQGVAGCGKETTLESSLYGLHVYGGVAIIDR